MAGRIEKTVFISYRRTNLPWALFIYQNLTMHGYDVFFDYQSIDSGSFEKVILDNIRARAHFVLILTPSALERCKNPGDWLRREIETAIDEKRNIVPLMMENFDFGSPLVKDALTGKLATISGINALSVPNDYALEAMDRLRDRFLNKAIDDVSLPSLQPEAEKATEIQKSAANEAEPVQEEKLTAQTWFERGFVFQENDNFDEAYRCYSEAIRLDPQLDGAYNNLGNVLRDLKRYEEAETAYRKAIELNPTYDKAYYNLGLLLHEKLNRKEESEVAYRNAIDINPNYLTYTGLGILLHDLKRSDESEVAFRKAIELNPTYDKAYYNFGNVLRDLKRSDEAETTYRKAIELNPPYDKAYNSLGLLLHDLKRNEESETAYRKAIELNPAQYVAYYNLGILLRDLKRNEESETAYRKAIELNPTFDKAYSNLGALLHDLKRNDEAEATYRKAIELNPTDDITHSNLGALLHDLKRNDEAEVAFRKAIELNASDESLYIRLINLLRVELNKAQDALPLLKKWLELKLENFNAHLAIASINKQLGKEISKENVEKARQFMPADDWYNLACLESVCDNFDSAFEYLEKASKQEEFDSIWAWEDPDFQWIRDDPRFTKIVGAKPE